MEKPSPEVRDFSKEHSGEERLKTAKEIKDLRKEHFAEKQDVGEKISNLIDDIENKAIDLEQAEQEVAGLRDELQEYADSKVRAFLGYFKKRSIEKELESKAPQEIKIKEDCEELLGLLYDLQEQFFDRSRLDIAKNKLGKFYGDQKELLEKYKHDEEVRDVGNVIKKHNCLFVHGIQTRDTPDYNTLITDGVDWETKIKIALSLGPTLSTSTIRRGDSMFAYWSNVGLLLKGGRVETAAARDNATMAKSIKTRVRAGGDSDENIEDAIGRSLHSRENNNRYNELTVAEPVSAGLYLAYDSPKMRNGGLTAMHNPEKDMSGERLLKASQDTGLPVYLIVDGVPYEAIYDAEKKYYKQGKELTVADIVNNGVGIEQNDKERMIDGLFENSPFNRVPDEVTLAASFQYGRGFYVELMHKSMQSHGVETTYKNERPSEYRSFLPEGAPIVDLGSIANAGFTKRYMSYKGELYEDISFLRERRNTGGSKFIHKKVEDDDSSRTYIECSMGSIGGENPIKNVEDYILAMSDIKERKNKIDKERLAGVRLDLVDYREKSFKTIVSHVCGFAKQAEIVGDEETKEKALKLVEGIMSMDQLAEITTRRFGPNGEVKITAEDLP